METHTPALHNPVEANRRKRAREEEASSLNAAQETKRAKEVPPTASPTTAEDRARAAKAIRDEERRMIEAQYLDLPPLPPRIPQPEYLVGSQKMFSMDDASTRFFSDCAQGSLARVRAFAEASNPSQADLQYGLEKAAQGFHLDVVRYLIEQRGAKLHALVFERMNPAIPWTQNIFSSGNPKLFELITIFLNNGWHPNQVWRSGSSQSNVALHYPNCLRNVSILRLLLQHGADPTISRHVPPSLCFHYFPQEAPVQRKSGDVLEMAAKNGTRETIDLLLAYGAKLEYGKALHILISKSPAARLGQLPTRSVDPGRYEMARHLLSLGEDIDGIKDVSDLVKPHSIKPVGGLFFFATPLSHAVGCEDWAFVEWLLENGADPEAFEGQAFSPDPAVYNLDGKTAAEANRRLTEMVGRMKLKGAVR